MISYFHQLHSVEQNAGASDAGREREHSRLNYLDHEYNPVFSRTLVKISDAKRLASLF
jgi:hypothetical protein